MLECASRPWTPVLAPSDAAAAAGVAREVAARLAGDRLAPAVRRAGQGGPGAARPPWRAYALAHGRAGLALLLGQVDACFPGDGWDRAAHRQLEAAAGAAARHGRLPPGAFSGLAGLGFAALGCSRGGARYRRLLDRVDQALVPRARALAGRVARRHGLAAAELDVVAGLSGIGAYLLCRRDAPGPAEALDQVLASLAGLLADPAPVPRWHTPAHLLAGKEQRRAYPHGNLNCGLAHGLPGPLALLSLAQLAGARSPGLAEAVERAVGWLAAARCDDVWGPNWPAAVGLPAPGGRQPPAEPSRAAWCYGTPGVARALWLSGAALGHAGYRELATGAIEAVLRRPPAARRVDAPTFCHGGAGLLQVTLRLARDSGRPALAAGARTLAGQLLAGYQPDAPFGFRDLGPGGRPVDRPGLLDGAPGAALVLLAAATDVEPAWDRVFLLS
jgi:lantibiotic biosynthesis protein